MKPLFATLGIVIGSVIAMLLTSADWARWTGGLLGCFLGYHAANFFAYQKSSPKSLLAFHGPNSPITKTTSEGEMAVILERLIKGGLVLGLVTEIGAAKVDRGQWEKLSPEERLACAQILSQACLLKGAAHEITVFSEGGDVLAKYPSA